MDEEGVLRWAEDRYGHNGRKCRSKGDRAGTVNADGYIYVKVDGAILKAHRIVWAMTRGEWPESDLDHINGIRADNRPANLREATKMQNSQNAGLRKDNTTGHRGVSIDRRSGRFFASIKGKVIGRFHDINDAITARKAAEVLYFGEFRRV